MSEEDIESLIAERTAAKKARNFTRSDEIRAQLLEAGIIIEDTKDGSEMEKQMKLVHTRCACGGPEAARDSARRGCLSLLRFIRPPATSITTWKIWTASSATKCRARVMRRHGNPTNDALEELVTALECGRGRARLQHGHGRACTSRYQTALLDRRKRHCGRERSLRRDLQHVDEDFRTGGRGYPSLSISATSGAAEAIEEHRPGALLMETISQSAAACCSARSHRCARTRSRRAVDR